MKNPPLDDLPPPYEAAAYGMFLLFFSFEHVFIIFDFLATLDNCYLFLCRLSARLRFSTALRGNATADPILPKRASSASWHVPCSTQARPRTTACCRRCTWTKSSAVPNAYWTSDSDFHAKRSERLDCNIWACREEWGCLQELWGELNFP